MTKGTKIFLAVFATLIGVMVLYYGLMLPEPQLPPALSVAANNPSAPREQALPIDVSTPPVPTERAPALAAPPETQSGVTPGFLTQSVLTMNSEVAAADPPQLHLPETVQPVSSNPPVSQNETQNPPAPAPVNPTAATVPLANQPIEIKPTSNQVSTSMTTEYVVQSGDTMTSIAEDWFGDSSKWSVIARENPLVDPNRLSIGQKLRLPAKDVKAETAKPAPPATGEALFTVRAGDTLAKIAREYYGDFAKWKAIYDLNKSAIGSDPGNLKPGMKLKLPPPSKPAT